MTLRRALLIAGAAGMVITAPSLVTAADVEAEGAVYQGATTKGHRLEPAPRWGR